MQLQAKENFMHGQVTSDCGANFTNFQTTNFYLLYYMLRSAKRHENISSCMHAIKTGCKNQIMYVFYKFHNSLHRCLLYTK